MTSRSWSYSRPEADCAFAVVSRKLKFTECEFELLSVLSFNDVCKLSVKVWQFSPDCTARPLIVH